VFAVIGMIAVGAVVLGIAGLGYIFYEGSKLDREATDYSAEAVVAITSNWNAQALRSRAAPPLTNSMTPDQAVRIFTWLGSLGPLQDRPDCQGNAAVYAGTGGRRTTANITCNAHYRAGPASVQLALTKSGGVWSILGFHVTSPALLPQQPMQKA
jgi:hypothetical protein